MIGAPRKMEPVTPSILNNQVAAIMSRWKQGEYLGRLTSKNRELMVRWFFKNRIFPDLQWWGGFYDVRICGKDLFGCFSELVQSRAVGSSLYLAAVITFSVMKCLNKGDTATWFRLKEDLALSLLTTNLKGVKAGDLVMPYSGFYVEFPKGLISFYHEDSGFHEMRTMCICEGFIPSPDDFEVLEFSEANRSGLIDIAGRRIVAICYCEPNATSKTPVDDAVFYYVLPVHDDNKSLEEIGGRVDEVLAGVDIPSHVVGGVTAGTFLGAKLDAEQMQQVVSSLVVNFLLYVSSKDADIIPASTPLVNFFRKKKKTSKVKKKIATLKALPDFEVGSHVVIQPGLREALRNSNASASKSKAVNVLVRGHWRHAWYGKKTEESPKGEGRHWVWVQPFVRNKATGAVLGHQYEVR